MTVIVWDGNILAADRQGTSEGHRITTTKIKRIGSNLVAVCGRASATPMLMKWYEDGCNPETYPKRQEDDDKGSYLLVIKKGGKVYRYDDYPIPWEVKDKRVVLGSGRDFALGAMAMGADAVEAVKVTNKLCTTCGMGVDFIRLRDGK